MSQHTGSHKNSLNLFGEKYLNESHWLMHRIRLLECTKFNVSLYFYFNFGCQSENVMLWQ